MGPEVELHPEMILVSLLIFGTLLGVVGLLLAVPVAVFLAPLADELVSKETSQEVQETEEASTLGNPGT